MAFKYAIALTGGIASGKSSAISLLKLGGFRVIDADEVAHQILEASGKEIAELFGEEYLENGVPSRPKLGKLVFSNPEKRVELEKLLHPKIYEKISEESSKLDKFKFPYLIDIPLYFEKRNYDIKNVVLVYTPRELQISRGMKRDSLSKEEILKRIDSQIDIEEKRKMSEIVLDNSGNLTQLQSEVERVTKILKSLDWNRN
jgi:dephospho-CoA kinase